MIYYNHSIYSHSLLKKSIAIIKLPQNQLNNEFSFKQKQKILWEKLHLQV